MGAPSLRHFKLDRTFFGYERKDRPKLHDALFELVWAGEGRWDWNTIYNMPIWLRNFWVRKLNRLAELKKQALDKQKRKSTPHTKIQKPGV